MFVELFGLLADWRKSEVSGATQEEIDLVAFDWDYVATVHCPCNTLMRRP